MQLAANPKWHIKKPLPARPKEKASTSSNQVDADSMVTQSLHCDHLKKKTRTCLATRQKKPRILKRVRALNLLTQSGGGLFRMNTSQPWKKVLEKPWPEAS